MKKWISSNFLDRCGITVSGLCGVHCVALGAIALLQPFSTWAGQHLEVLHWAEFGMVIAATLFAGIALVSGFRHHGHAKPVALGLLALTLLWAVVATPLHELTGAPLLTLLGGIGLIVAHRWNIKCRCAHKAMPTAQ